MMRVNMFLKWVGWILLALGVLGYIVKDTWAPFWDLTAGENLAHVVLGIVTLALCYWSRSADLKKWYTVLVGVVALYFAAYGWFVSPNYYGYATLEQLDNVAHLVIGVWALWAVWGGKKR